MGDILRTPYHKDVPRAFKIISSNGKEKIVGAYGRLIVNFAKFMNYTLELVDEDDFVTSQVQQKIYNKFYNISMLAGSYQNRFAEIDFTYPLESSSTCVMVPAKGELPRYWYVVWPFGRYIWLVLIISMLYVALVMTYLKHPTNVYSNNLLHSMALIIYSPNASLRLVNIPLRLQLFYTLLLIMGFIISSYYCSFLTMYNMKPLSQPYIKSIDDALAAKIKIFITFNTLEELRNNNDVNLSPIAVLLQQTDPSVISNSINELNRSYAYMISTSNWDFIVKLQKNAIQPIYQLSNICFGQTFITYPIQVKSKFKNSLKNFIMLCHELGFWKYWQEEAFMTVLNHNLYSVLSDNYPVDPLAMSYYRLAWILYVGGVITSCIAFAFERIFYNYKLRGASIRKNKSLEV